MAQKILKKSAGDGRNVYESSLDRIRYLYDHYDRVVVSFSGGKDSTVCLNLALAIAREKNRLPLDVYFFDEEAIHPETIEYVDRVSRHPDIRFKWLCVPVQHRNACSRYEPYWYPWDQRKKDLWVREMPEGAITHIDGFEHEMSMPDIAHRVYDPDSGSVADIRGIRAQESLRRYQSVARREYNNWIGSARDGYNYPTSPIYDWTAVDVWTAPRLLGWDYNHAYDLMYKAGVPTLQQRVCPPYGEEPLGGLWLYATCWPDLWDRMIRRVDGAATAGRYCRTQLYGFGAVEKPPQFNWKEFTFYLLDLYPDDLKKRIGESIAQMIRKHETKTSRPIHDSDADLLTGMSWRFIAGIVNRADLKDRRKNKVEQEAINMRARLGMDIKEAEDLDYGTRY